MKRVGRKERLITTMAVAQELCKYGDGCATNTSVARRMGLKVSTYTMGLLKELEGMGLLHSEETPRPQGGFVRKFRRSVDF